MKKGWAGNEEERRGRGGKMKRMGEEGITGEVPAREWKGVAMMGKRTGWDWDYKYSDGRGTDKRWGIM